MKKKVVFSLIIFVMLITMAGMVMADEYVEGLYENVIHGLEVNMIWVGIVIIILIALLITLSILKKKGKIKINEKVYKIIVSVIAVVLIGFICYEVKLIWDYAGVKPAYEYIKERTA